jgi:hypothetical protein
MFSVIYVGVWLALAYTFYAKAPRVKPKMDGCLVAIAVLNFYLAFAVVGFSLPTFLQQKTGLSFGPDWLMRASQLVGAVSGFYVGWRGMFVWGVLGILGISIGIAGFLALAAWQFVVNGLNH